MASDRTGGGQPASHLAGIEDRGGEAGTEDVRGGWGCGPSSVASQRPASPDHGPVLIIGAIERFCKGNRLLGSQAVKSFKFCCNLHCDDGPKECPVLDVSVKEIKDWEVLRNIQIFQVNGISAISSSIQFLSCSTTKTSRDHRQRQTVHSGGNC